MSEAKNPFLAPNKTVAVVIYVLTYLVGGSLIITILALMYNSYHKLGLNPLELLHVIGATDLTELQAEQLKLYAFCNSLGNLLMYGVLFIAVLFYMRDHLIEDAKGLIKNYKKLAWLIPVCAIVGYGLSYGVEAIISMFIQKDSMNQSTIEVLIYNGGAIPMFFAVVICAPIVEELIYRKAIFEYLKKYHIAISYVVSIVIFTLPHVLSTFIEPGYTLPDKILICIPYMLSGFLLCLTYHLCNKNIYASWFFHLINNLISFI
ncbi:MAG: CPBP family intramembrane metalloprotease, partial [Anaeroplasmataceae bacterium]|nr:CPBP family intramembrane metalloprotease [Anaeroplasmataceae bacterium]